MFDEANTAVKTILIILPVVFAMLFSAYYHFKVLDRRLITNYRNFVRARRKNIVMTVLLALLGFFIGILVDGFILGTFDTFLGLTGRVM